MVLRRAKFDLEAAFSSGNDYSIANLSGYGNSSDKKAFGHNFSVLEIQKFQKG